ncbi:MAG: chloride channel protein [Planctomycetes bacterium]|nr:chloride channel protein [Planctomycetota bacterium]
MVKRLIRGFELGVSGKWFLLSGLIGVVAGLGAIAFHLLTQAVLYLSLGLIAGYSPGDAAGEHVLFRGEPAELRPWLLVAVVACGGLVSGCIVYTFAPEAEGPGTDAAIDAFHNRRGHISPRIPLVKTLASAITLGTGGSAGREGPIAQIGAGFGSFLGQRLGLSARDRRIMLAAGMGAGVGAIFRAPLAGALFAGEILYRDADLESEVVVPAAMASIIAYSVYCLSLPADKWFSPLFGSRLDYQVASPLELIPYTLLALVLVGVGILYIKTLQGTQGMFRRVPVPRHFRPMLGAGLAGLVGVGLYFAFDGDRRVLAVLSTGYGSLQEALRPAAGDFPGGPGLKVLVAIALVKIVTTSLTIGSGGSGGVFGPSMVIGGCLGAAVGRVLADHAPAGLVTEPQSYAIVGMAGFFAGCAHAPFSTIIMVLEMTGTYNLLLPTMWVSLLCFLLCRRWTLYVNQVPTRLESPAHRGDFLVDVLEGIKVGDVYHKHRKLLFIPESMSLDGIVHTLAKTNQHYFPVVDADGRLVGIFSSDDVRTWLYDQTIWQLAVARDVMVSRIVSISPDDDLNTAMQRFTMLEVDELPVIDPADPDRLLGMLRHAETIAAYNRRLMEHKRATEE